MLKYLCCAFLASYLVACATEACLVLPSNAPLDNTVPEDLRPAIASIMVLSPAGNERGAAISEEIIAVERALLKRGIRVVSSGITARAVSGTNAASPTAAATKLSDLERALILARDTHVDALLQITELRYEPFELALSETHGRLLPATASDQTPTHALASLAMFKLRARLIEVAEGDILLSIDLSQSTARALPVDERRAIPHSGVEHIDLATSDRKQHALTQVMEAMLGHFASKNTDVQRGEEHGAP